MKPILSILFVVSALLFAGCTTVSPTKMQKQTYSSFDLPSEHSDINTIVNGTIPAGTINFQGVDLNQVLRIYGAVSCRNVLHGPLPDARIYLQTATPLNPIEVLQTLDTVLAQNGIAMVLSGDKAVKAVPTMTATSESPPEIDLPWQLLPDSSSMMMRTVHLKNLKPSVCVPVLMPFSKLPNSLVVVDDQHLLIIRDYSTNVRQQLKLLEELEAQAKP